MSVSCHYNLIEYVKYILEKGSDVDHVTTTTVCLVHFISYETEIEIYYYFIQFIIISK